MIYLDNAATSYPKPREVRAAVEGALSLPLGNPGRSAHAPAMSAAQLLLRARGQVASLFGVQEEQAVFTLNTTHALNLAIFGLCLAFTPPKNTVLTDRFQHNSVLRPLYALEREGKIRLRFCDPHRVEEAMDASVALGVFSARSNVTGEAFPLPRIACTLHRGGALFLCDGAQGAGNLSLHLSQIGADCLAVPGHKGLMGIMGAGALLLAPQCPALLPLITGGSGSESRSHRMPGELPDRLEAGTPPLIAAVAMGAGAAFVQAQGVARIARREASLAALLRERLAGVPGLRLYSPAESGGIVLLNREGRSPHALAAALAERGICARAGLHCAPLAHGLLGTGEEGALRFSFGFFNTPEEALAAAELLSGL